MNNAPPLPTQCVLLAYSLIHSVGVSEFSHTTLHWGALYWRDMWKKRDILVTLLPKLTRFRCLGLHYLGGGGHVTRNNTLEFSAVNFSRQIEIPDLFSKHAWTLDFYCACLQHNLTFSHLFCGGRWPKSVYFPSFLRNVPTNRFASVTSNTSGLGKTREEMKSKDLHCYS